MDYSGTSSTSWFLPVISSESTGSSSSDTEAFDGEWVRTDQHMTATNVQLEQKYNLHNPSTLVRGLHTVIQEAVKKSIYSLKSAYEGQLQNFTERDFILVVQDGFNENETLCLRWRGNWRITKAIHEYVYQVSELVCLKKYISIVSRYIMMSHFIQKPLCFIC